MDVLYHRCAGLDVHAETIVVCALLGEEEHVQKEVETFPTFTKDLFRLLKWLEDRGVTHIAMESTGVYWKPVFNILEDYFDITLANAQRIKNVPGRKTDVSDAEWIAKLLRYGLIEKSFVPPENIRELRDLTRLRKKWIGQLTAEKNRIQKVLECSNIKLSSVISDVFGVSGRKLLERLMKQGYIEETEVDACIHRSMKRKKTTNSGFSLWYIDQPSTVHDSPIVEAHRIVGKFTSRHRRTNRPTLTSIQTRDGASCDHTGGQEGNRCRDYR